MSKILFVLIFSLMTFVGIGADTAEACFFSCAEDNNDYDSYVYDSWGAILSDETGDWHQTQFTGGNENTTVGGGGYSPFGESGGTAFYNNGDGTWNTITYPPRDLSESDTCGGFSSCDNNVSHTCPPGSVPNGLGGCITVTQCPANNTLIGSSCCPNQYVVTTTVGSGKGQNTVRSCNIPPPTPPTATISQSKATTITGEAFTVSYGKSGEGAATSCVLQRQSPGGSYAQIASNSGNTSSKNENISTVGSYGYQAQCYGPGGSSAWTSLTHTVIVPPPTLSFSADQYLIPYNTATTLRWTSANTVSCAASSDWSGAKSTNGSESTGNLTELSTYFLQCQGRANQSTNPAVVNVNIEYGEGSIIEVTPTITHKNTPVTVTWNTGTSNPANCQIETGSVVLRSPLTSNTGSLTYTVNGETTFTINCEAGHNTAETVVKVLPEFQET